MTKSDKANGLWWHALVKSNDFKIQLHGTRSSAYLNTTQFQDMPDPNAGMSSKVNSVLHVSQLYNFIILLKMLSGILFFLILKEYLRTWAAVAVW